MGKSSFVIAGGRAAIVANDVCDFRYRAGVHHLARGEQVSARSNALAETQIMVEDGVIEMMVGGGACFVLPGDFVRVPPGVVFGYRNIGDDTATLLIRSSSPEAPRRARKLAMEFAA